MRLKSGELLAGVPALSIRNALRSIGVRAITCARLASSAGIDMERAGRVLRTLQERGMIQAEHVEKGNAHFVLTKHGEALRDAKAGQPLRRNSCLKILAGFLERVEQARVHPQLLMRVRRVVLFGALAAGLERLWAIELGVELESKEPDEQRHQELWLAAVNKEIRRRARTGRHMSVHEQLAWPADQVRTFLKSRHRALSLWPFQEYMLEQPQARLIYVHHDDARGQRRLFDTDGI